MPQWQQEYNTNPQVRKLAAKFDDYKTVDWRYEKHIEAEKYYEALSHSSDVAGSASPALVLEPLSPLGPPSTGGSLLSLSSAMSLLNDISTLKLIKSRLWTSLQSFIVLTISGVCIGSIAALLSVMTDYLNDIKTMHVSDWAIVQFIVYLLVSVTFGTLASLACVMIAPTAAGSGISEVKCIVSGFQRPSFLTFRTLVVKALALPFTIASGLAVGKEGPSVHYASCVGDVVARAVVPWFGDSPTVLAEVVTAAAGTGVAVAFGSPLGGVLFGVEEIWGRAASVKVMWRTFYMALVAVTVLRVWNPFGTGQIVMFSVRYERDWVWSEVLWFAVLGVFGGVYGVCVSRWNIKWVAFRRGWMPHGGGVREVAVLCTVSAVVGWWNTYLRGDMTRVMEILFDAGDASGIGDGTLQSTGQWLYMLFELGYATVIRIVLVCISYGCCVPCGIFVPSMAIGATFGKLLGMLLESVQYTEGDGVSSGTYAFLGAGAALSGITGLNVTVVVILYELTGAIKYIIPSMVVVVGVRIVMELCGNGFGGIADQMIKFNGMPYIDLKEEHNFTKEDGSDVIANEVMVPLVIGLDAEGMRIRDVLRVLNLKKEEYPVLWQRSRIVGVMKRSCVEEIVRRAKSGDEGIDGDVDISMNISMNMDKAVHFVSREAIERGIGEAVDETETTMEYNDSVDELMDFEYTTVALDASMYSVFDVFVDVGVRQVYVLAEDGSIVGVMSRKDLVRYENYKHHRDHDHGDGDVFVSSRDRELFDRLQSVYR